MIREATQRERAILFDGDPGYVVEEGNFILGAVGYNFKHTGLFYAHSLFSAGSPGIASRLFQRVRKQAKTLGFDKIDFVVSDDQTALLKLLESGKARMKQVWLEIKT